MGEVCLSSIKSNILFFTETEQQQLFNYQMPCLLTQKLFEVDKTYRILRFIHYSIGPIGLKTVIYYGSK